VRVKWRVVEARELKAATSMSATLQGRSDQSIHVIISANAYTAQTTKPLKRAIVTDRIAVEQMRLMQDTIPEPWHSRAQRRQGCDVVCCTDRAVSRASLSRPPL